MEKDKRGGRRNGAIDFNPRCGGNQVWISEAGTSKTQNKEHSGKKRPIGLHFCTRAPDAEKR